MTELDPDRPVGEEARKSHGRRIRSGFIEAYLRGSAILDIGYKGYLADVVPIVPGATGVELDYPGYDGVTLPFAEHSQDAVFASHCLEHIEDFQNAIRDWFRVLRIGGHLVIMVPHQFLYEKQTALPSRYNADHKRFYTPASLMAEIEMSLRPNTYRLRHLVDNDAGFDYALPPQRHSGGCYEIELVIEKIRPPGWYLAKPLPPLPACEDRDARKEKVPATAESARIVGPVHRGNPVLRVIPREMIPAGGDAVAIYDFGAPGSDAPGPVVPEAGRPRILVLKLDHLGDFIIGRPALRRLREAFPTADIRLVVGGWNRAEAIASGLADSVVAYDFFPQQSLGWDGKPHERVEKFRTLTAGRYDIAIDLRVDDDTRFLLGEVDAAMRCGIGLVARTPLLDVALPPEHPIRDTPTGLDAADRALGPARFESRMPFRHAVFHETDFRPQEGHAVYGPYLTLPVGHFTALFDLQLDGWKLGLKGTAVTLDVARDGEIVASKRLRGAALRALPEAGVGLEFDNDDPLARHEFRIHIAGQPRRTRLRFGGVRLDHVEAAGQPRFRRAELHIGEQLSLLVQLVADRGRALYPAAAWPPAEAIQASGPLQIAIAPFSNSDLRDWPVAHYVALVRLLIARLDCAVTLLGTGSQAEALERLAQEAAQGAGDGARIRNLGGRTAWSDMPALLRAADLVICNNSGIAHLAAACGARTLAIYSASHQPQEWGPRGQHSHALMAVVPCSPCGHDRLDECPYEHRCMRGLAPQTVFAQAASLLAAGRAAATELAAAPSDTAP